MNRYTLVPLLAGLLLSVKLAQPVWAAPSSAAEQQLIHQIKQGEALFRDDIVNDAVQRLYRISPQHPQGLLAELRLALRLNQPEQAQAKLAQLQQSAPSSDEYADARLLVALTEPEREVELTQARLLARAGQYAEARERYDRLLQGRYPTPELAQEYWQVRVGQTAEYTAAITALEASLKQFPRHAGLLRSLVNYYFAVNKPDTALQYLHQLAERSTERQWAATREYEYLSGLALSDHSQALWQDFVQRYADLTSLQARAQDILTAQQARLDDPAWRAGQTGLAAVEAQKNPTQALAQLQQALRSYPDDVEIIGSIGLAYLRLNNRAQALHYFERAIATEQEADRKSRWISLANSTKLWLLLSEAEGAADKAQWATAQRLYQQVYQRESTNLFAVLGLARSYLAQGNNEQAWQYYQKAMRLDPHNESVQWGVVAYADQFAPVQSIAILKQLPPTMQNKPVVAQALRNYELALLDERIAEAQQAEQWEQAIALMRQGQQLDISNAWRSYGLAVALRDQGRSDEALGAFRDHYLLHKGEVATQYAYALLLTSLDQGQRALKALREVELALWTEPMHELEQRVQQSLALAEAQQLYEQGETSRAIALLEQQPPYSGALLQLAEWYYEKGNFERSINTYQTLQTIEPLSASSYRALARSWQAAGKPPHDALNWYAQGMVAADLLPAEAVQAVRDDVAFTRAMRLEDTDDWLARGLRTEAEALYQQQNPTIRIHNDHWWRSDGTPGISELTANTTIVQMNYPIKSGSGFIRADHVRMDAGRLEPEADGVYRGELGTCSSGAGTACKDGFKQRAQGTSVAIGWAGKDLSFDLGTTPLGFPVSTWTGGISYSGNWRATGWRLTASRRPMSNSVLSFAGIKDIGTGVKWGGVMATGAALSLSWDQGEANGVWADLSHHVLKGKNVQNNQRSRVMGGYYRRLINKNHELLSVGVNAMHWRYQKGLGGYGFREGGYYSPKHYNSLSLPVRYAKRTANWSFVVEGGASFSSAKNHQGETSRGLGYTLSGGVERRLNKHWVLGAGLDLQHSKDYAPSRGMLYLRYTFEPWQGSLPLGLDPLTPYADFK